MRASPKAFQLIRDFEGFRAKAYICPAGVPTIGYGHTGPNVVIGMPDITQEAADTLLARDIAATEAQVNLLVKSPLTQGEFDALVSFVFNLGAAALKSSTLLRIINTIPYHGTAAREFDKWVFAKNPKTGKMEKLPGLIRRREAERNLFLS